MVKLSIELVPSSCWYSNVRSEVSQKQWNIIKNKVSLLANNVCEICGGKGHKWPVECHEVWHYDDKLLIQKLEKMIALCPQCHEVKHFGLAAIRGRADKAKDHLRKINSWDLETAESYINNAFVIWERRSKLLWTLDIEKLNEYII